MSLFHFTQRLLIPMQGGTSLVPTPPPPSHAGDEPLPPILCAGTSQYHLLRIFASSAFELEGWSYPAQPCSAPMSLGAAQCLCRPCHLPPSTPISLLSQGVSAAQILVHTWKHCEDPAVIPLA